MNVPHRVVYYVDTIDGNSTPYYNVGLVGMHENGALLLYTQDNHNVEFAFAPGQWVHVERREEEL